MSNRNRWRDKDWKPLEARLTVEEWVEPIAVSRSSDRFELNRAYVAGQVIVDGAAMDLYMLDGDWDAAELTIGEGPQLAIGIVRAQDRDAVFGTVLVDHRTGLFVGHRADEHINEPLKETLGAEAEHFAEKIVHCTSRSDVRALLFGPQTRPK